MKVDSDARPPKRFKPDTSFSREEFEIMATHNSSKKGDSQGDRMLEWASNPAFRSKNVRSLKMKTLHTKSIAEHVPDGVFREDFTETKDGAQKLIFSYRSLYEACKELLRNVRFAGSQYIQADVCYDGLGKRKLGALNRGEMYESCQRRVGSRVSAVPVFLGSDSTILCKKMGGHPIVCE